MRNSCDDKKQYSMQEVYTIEYLGEGTWATFSKNHFLEQDGLDRTLLQVFERTMLGQNRFVGYTYVT